MDETVLARRPPEPDWSALTKEALVTYREAENRFRASPEARPFTGTPDPGAAIVWQQLALPGRELPVRVYRPTESRDAPEAGLPLVMHVHGGGFVGTAAQSDWVNSHLAAHLPAVVVSVEHRLLDPDTPLSAAADDGWDSFQRLLEDAAQWNIDPERTVLFGESCGALICALTAIRAKSSGLRLRGQVLVNPVAEVTSTALDYDSTAAYGDSPSLNLPTLRALLRLAVPKGADPRAVSPLHAADLRSQAPALVLVPTHDPLADHGRTYAARLREAGTDVRLTEFPEAPHGFLSTPGLAPQAQEARTEVLGFIRDRLAE